MGFDIGRVHLLRTNDNAPHSSHQRVFARHRAGDIASLQDITIGSGVVISYSNSAISSRSFVVSLAMYRLVLMSYTPFSITSQCARLNSSLSYVV